MGLNSLCFIYRFFDVPEQTGFKIIGVHDQFRPWTPQQLAANGMITQKFQNRSSMESFVEGMALKYNVASYTLLSINEYNSLMEESHQLEDFRLKLQSRERSMLKHNLEAKVQEDQAAAKAQPASGLFSRIFGSKDQNI